MKLMKSLFISIFVAGLLVNAGVVSEAQELADPELYVFTTQKVSLTKYGLVVDYTTSHLYRDQVFLPTQWFIPALPSASKDSPSKNVRAYRVFAHLSYEQTPRIKVTYRNQKLHEVLLELPKDFGSVGLPLYNGPLSDEELAQKFAEQLNSDVLLMEAPEE